MLDASNIIAAFSEDQVQRLTGLTKTRLRYWDQTGFFSPTYSEDNKRWAYSRFYSFKDVVALRTIEVLRVQNNVALQHLRKVAEKLSHLKDDLWTKTTLYVLDRKVIFEEPGTGKPREILSGQYVIGLPLKKVINDTRRNVRTLQRRDDDVIGQVSRLRSVNANSWVIAGTRIPTATIKRFYEDGYTIRQIRKEYPDLKTKDIEAAIQHEKTRAKAA